MSKQNKKNRFVPFYFSSKKSRKGFALLIATLVSGLFLAISAVIFQIAYLQLLLSSVSRDSQFAFYAADTGAECALYWDRKYLGGDNSGSAFNVYDVSTNGAIEDTNRYKIETGTLGAIKCSGDGVQVITPTPSQADCRNPANSYRYCQGDFVGGEIGQTFIKFPVTDSNNVTRGCVEVVVTKCSDTNSPCTIANASTPILKTVIVSRGYNTCNIASDRRVERAIQITIQ